MVNDNQPNINVYIMTHGPICEIIPDYCSPLEIGCSVRNEFHYPLRDNADDDNISDKDSLYCELTGLYYIWKSDRHSITGLAHYRRLFTIDSNQIQYLIWKYDVIIPDYVYCKKSIRESYEKSHVQDDWNIMMDVLQSMYPDYYPDAVKIFEKSRFIPYNMFISKREILESYCEWLFPLLFSIEPKINLRNRSRYQGRAIGFLAERLFILWVFHNNLKVKNISVLTLPPSLDDELGRKIFNVRYAIASPSSSLRYKEWKADLKSKGIFIINNAGANSKKETLAVYLYNYSKLLFYYAIKCYNYYNNHIRCLE